LKHLIDQDDRILIENATKQQN